MCQPRQTMMNGWTVILNQDLQRQKKTDHRELLSMARHRPVVTHMKRSLTKVRGRISEKMVQAPPM